MMDQEGPRRQEETVRERKKFTTNPDGKYCCPTCPYTSDRRNNVDRHISSMHTITKSLHCCGQPFETKASLVKHVRSSHASKGYVCTDCGRAFVRRALLLRHSSVHTGIKNFGCTYCSYSTSHKTNLARHCKAHGHPPPDIITFQKHRKNSSLRNKPFSSRGESTSSHSSSPELQEVVTGGSAANPPPRLWQPWEKEEPLKLRQQAKDVNRQQGFLPLTWTQPYRPLPLIARAHQAAIVTSYTQFSWSRVSPKIVTLPVGQQILVYEHFP